MEDLVYFSINNWCPGRDFPDDLIFYKWVFNRQFSDFKWCRDNKICVIEGYINTSINWSVTATKSWVLANCPNLLSDREYSYLLKVVKVKRNLFGRVRRVVECTECKKRFSDFLCTKSDDGIVYDPVGGWPFLEYSLDNFGVFINTDWYSFND